jgi:hypothetical protein
VLATRPWNTPSPVLSLCVVASELFSNRNIFTKECKTYYIINSLEQTPTEGGNLEISTFEAVMFLTYFRKPENT